NMPQRWGNLEAQELGRACGLGTVSGSYVARGETYLHPREILWWSKGGTLHGESPKRIAFLRKIVEGSAPEGLDPLPGLKYLGAMASSGSTYLYYLDLHQPAELEFDLPTNTKFAA